MTSLANSKQCMKQFCFDLSSDFMLVPHTFINLTGGKISVWKKIWKVDPNVQKPFILIWPHSNGTMKDWILAPVFWRFWREFLNAAANSLHSFNHNKDRDDVHRLNREQEQKQSYFSLHRFVILFFDEVFSQQNHQRRAEKVSAVLSFW